MFLVVGHQVCTHLRRDFVPLLFADPLQVIKVSMTRTFSSLHIFSMGLKSGDWQGHSRTLMCFFLSHSFIALAVCYVYGRMLSMPWWYMVPLMRCSCPGPLAEKHPQSIMFPPPCLTVGMVFLGHRQHSSSSKHGELS